MKAKNQRTPSNEKVEWKVVSRLIVKYIRGQFSIQVKALNEHPTDRGDCCV